MLYVWGTCSLPLWLPQPTKTTKRTLQTGREIQGAPVKKPTGCPTKSECSISQIQKQRIDKTWTCVRPHLKPWLGFPNYPQTLASDRVHTKPKTVSLDCNRTTTRPKEFEFFCTDSLRGPQNSYMGSLTSGSHHCYLSLDQKGLRSSSRKSHPSSSKQVYWQAGGLFSCSKTKEKEQCCHSKCDSTGSWRLALSWRG